MREVIVSLDDDARAERKVQAGVDHVRRRAHLRDGREEPEARLVGRAERTVRDGGRQLDGGTDLQIAIAHGIGGVAGEGVRVDVARGDARPHAHPPHPANRQAIPLPRSLPSSGGAPRILPGARGRAAHRARAHSSSVARLPAPPRRRPSAACRPGPPRTAPRGPRGRGGTSRSPLRSKRSSSTGGSSGGRATASAVDSPSGTTTSSPARRTSGAGRGVEVSTRSASRDDTGVNRTARTSMAGSAAARNRSAIAVTRPPAAAPLGDRRRGG